jgi:uncharacterized protein (TIGR03086 family)
MDINDQLDEIAPQLATVASGVRLDQFDNATPCAKFKVRDLFDHMIGGAGGLAAQLRGDEPAPPRSVRDEERAEALTEALDDLCASARTPGALGREITLPFGVVPGSVVVRFLTVDGMVHTWDIATATGQEFRPDDGLAGAVLESARQLIADEMRDGDTFAPAQPVAPGAGTLTQLIAFSGRTV